MGLAFKRRRKVKKRVRQLAGRLIDKALRSLADQHRAEAVHDVRKEIKKLRALLRMVRFAMKPSEYRRSSAALRQAAHLLSPARDAQVTCAALKNLSRRFPTRIPRQELDTVAESLGQDPPDDISPEKARSKVALVLQQVRNRPDSFRVHRSGWKALACGLKHTYRQGRKAYQAAQKTASIENLHQWRKRVKDLFYQTGLLCPAWPAKMLVMQAGLKRLGQILGDDHDLALLQLAVRRLSSNRVPARFLRDLTSVLVQRRQALQVQALAMGEQLHSAKPSDFCRRLHRYWKHWRNS